MEYKVVHVDGNPWAAQLELEKKVNRLLDLGWKLQGGVSISVYQVGYAFHTSLTQAMVRETRIHR